MNLYKVNDREWVNLDRVTKVKILGVEILGGGKEWNVHVYAGERLATKKFDTLPAAEAFVGALQRAAVLHAREHAHTPEPEEEPLPVT